MAPNIDIIKGLAKINYALFDQVVQQATRVDTTTEGPFKLMVYYQHTNIIGVSVLDRNVTKCYTKRELKDIIIQNKRLLKEAA
ncbi:hypothetical protein [Ralstonia phage RP13]|nr:hypothetical protein [Ralstonia phage RP13]